MVNYYLLLLDQSVWERNIKEIKVRFTNVILKYEGQGSLSDAGYYWWSNSNK